MSDLLEVSPIGCSISLVHISQENVRCMMGYIVNLTVILDAIFRTTSGSVTGNAALEVVDKHVSSGCRDSIHRDIRSFVAETFPIRFANPEGDPALDKIISSIKHYCTGLSSIS